MRIKKRKVLIVSYNFPPMGGGGVLRVLKFCKYLPQFNWDPIVLTVKQHDTDFFDKNLFSDIPLTEVHKTNCIDIPIIYKKYLSLASIKNKNKNLNAELKGNQNIVKKLADNLILIPDSRIGWIPFALSTGMRICRNADVDLIFSTGGPWTNHLIGAMLNSITKLPWIADFRDSWTENSFTVYPFRSRKKVEEKMEKYVLINADSIVTATHSISKELMFKYPKIEIKKYSVITNGFDSEDFTISNKTVSNGFSIIHTGNFYGDRTAKYFLLALRELKKENFFLRNGIKVKFVGEVNKNEKNRIESFGLKNIVKCLGCLPHQECIQLLVESNILLLIVGNENSEVTGKVYEYMAAKRHILALTGKGEVTDILRKTGMATIVNSTDVGEIKNAIERLYVLSKKNDLATKYNKNFINKFDRKNLSSKLAALFYKTIH
jgi:hypothetical protein